MKRKKVIASPRVNVVNGIGMTSWSGTHFNYLQLLFFCFQANSSVPCAERSERCSRQIRLAFAVTITTCHMSTVGRWLSWPRLGLGCTLQALILGGLTRITMTPQRCPRYTHEAVRHPPCTSYESYLNRFRCISHDFSFFGWESMALLASKGRGGPQWPTCPVLLDHAPTMDMLYFKRVTNRIGGNNHPSRTGCDLGCPNNLWNCSRYMVRPAHRWFSLQTYVLRILAQAQPKPRHLKPRTQFGLLRWIARTKWHARGQLLKLVHGLVSLVVTQYWQNQSETIATEQDGKILTYFNQRFQWSHDTVQSSSRVSLAGSVAAVQQVLELWTTAKQERSKTARDRINKQ